MTYCGTFYNVLSQSVADLQWTMEVSYNSQIRILNVLLAIFAHLTRFNGCNSFEIINARDFSLSHFVRSLNEYSVRIAKYREKINQIRVKFLHL